MRSYARHEAGQERQPARRSSGGAAVAESLSGLRLAAAQLMAREEDEAEAGPAPAQLARAANHTGLPDDLKNGAEALSGLSLDDVRVHYGSSEPAQLSAHAYAKGTDIYLAPGQEKHLPHETWHVVQQKQGRVRPTAQLKGGVPLNDEPELEREADRMGERAAQLKRVGSSIALTGGSATPAQVVQRSGVSIEITDGTKSAVGESGPPGVAEGKFARWPSIKNLFDRVEEREEDGRSRYQCAEPHALANLLQGYYLSEGQVGRETLCGARFTKKAYNSNISDTTNKVIGDMDPCLNCRQWVEPNLTLNPAIFPPEDTIVSTRTADIENERLQMLARERIIELDKTQTVRYVGQILTELIEYGDLEDLASTALTLHEACFLNEGYRGNLLAYMGGLQLSIGALEGAKTNKAKTSAVTDAQKALNELIEYCKKFHVESEQKSDSDQSEGTEGGRKTVRQFLIENGVEFFKYTDERLLDSKHDFSGFKGKEVEEIDAGEDAVYVTVGGVYYEITEKGIELT